MAAWRVFVLMVYQPAAGMAIRPVGVLGLRDGEPHVSWIPYERGTELWLERLTALGVPLSGAVGRWLATSDGISSDIIEVTPPDAEDLATAVERTVDLLLAADAREEAS